MKNLRTNWLKLVLTTFFGLSTFFIISASAFAAAPTGTSAVLGNSTLNPTTKVEITLTGTDFVDFVTNDNTTAAAGDLSKMHYNGQTADSAIIFNATTLKVNFLIAIGTAKSGGNFVIDAGALEDAVDGNENATITIANGSVTDSAKPVMLSLTKTNASSRNKIAFTYSEVVSFSDGPSVAALGDVTTAGLYSGIGTFVTAGTPGNVTVPTSTKNTLSGNGTTVLTLTLANETGGYLSTASTTEPSGIITVIASASLTDAASNQALVTGVTPTVSSGSAWDLTKPTLSSTTVLDAANTANNGKLDTVQLVFSENIRDNSFTDANGTLGALTGTFATGSANDTIMAFGLTSDASQPVDTSVSGTAKSFLYSGATTLLTDMAGNLLDTASDGIIAAADATEIDGAKPVLTAVAAGTSSGANTIAFTYSEPVTTCNGASTATCGDLTTVGTFAGLGNFGTDGNIKVLTGKNTVSGTGTATITVTLGGQTSGYMYSTDVSTLTVPSGTVAGNGTAGVVDGASNQVNTSSTAVTASPLPGAQWDVTRPTISGCVLTDTYYNDAAFVAGSSGFHAGQDGKVDTLTCTSSATLKTITDATETRNDWTVSGSANEFGNSLTVIKAAASGTTYTINFSGALIAYADYALTLINTQEANDGSTLPSFVNAGGNTVASGLATTTYKICKSGFTCSGGDLGNSAVITANITQPSGGGSEAVAGPVAATGLAATVTSDMKVKLTWVDPANASTMMIYKTLNSSGEVVAGTVGGGVKTYTDSSVSSGDTAKYRVVAYDISGHEGTKTDYITIKVEAAATGTTTTGTGTTGTGTNTTTTTTTTTDETGKTTETTTTTVTKVVFKDAKDIPTWATEATEKLNAAGIMTGHADGTFTPGGDMNRADTARITCRVLKIDENQEATEAPFKDVGKNGIGGCVSALKSAGVVSATNVNFNPSNPITRAEFMKLAVKAYESFLEDQDKVDLEAKLNAKTPVASFTDVDLKNDWFANYASVAKDMGWTNGVSCGKTGTDKCFNGNVKISRAEAAVILHRIMKAVVKELE